MQKINAQQCDCKQYKSECKKVTLRVQKWPNKLLIKKFEYSSYVSILLVYIV